MSDNDKQDDKVYTPEGTEIDQSILGTAKIDPASMGKKANANRLASMKYAVAGLIYVLVHEPSIRYATITTVIVVAIGLWLRMSVFSWALLIIALGMVWVTECLNTAIEAVIDLASPEIHQLAKVGKDVASTAALVSTLVFVIIVLLIIVPLVNSRLGV